MIDGTLILIGRQTDRPERTLETHAARLRDRDVAGRVVIERFDGTEGNRRTGDRVSEEEERVAYAVPMTVAWTAETEAVIPSVAATVTDAPVLCAPVGRSRAVTEVLADRATDRLAPSTDVSLALVGLGSSARPDHRRVLEEHRRRLAARTAYDEVVTSYLLQDPAVECVPYNVANDDVVAVPVFVTPSGLTRDVIPDRLEHDGTDIACADPLGTHPQLTDAIQAEVARRHVIETRDAETRSTVKGVPDSLSGPVATDGRGSSG